MWKTLFLAVVFGLLAWLGLIEDKASKSDTDLFTTLKTMSSEFINNEPTEGKELAEGAESDTDLLSKLKGMAAGFMNNEPAEDTEQAESTESADSESADSESADSESADSESADSESADSESADSESAESETAESDGSEEASDSDSSDGDSTASADTDTASETAESSEPLTLTGMTRKIGLAIGTTTSLLSGVTDADSANAALPKLTEANENLGQLAQAIPSIPDVAKAPLSKQINSGIDRITPLADKALGNPGVSGVLQPVLGPMMDTLKGMTQ